MGPRIAIVFYSVYGHIQTLAEAEKRGIEAPGGSADLYQIAETLPESVLTQIGAPLKPSIPIIEPAELVEYDGMLLGIPTRFGNFPVQWKAFWDKTGPEWTQGAFWGKFVGVFVTTGILGGGQESTAMSVISTFAHHGLIYVPLGYKGSSHIQSKLDAARGGSAWGAGSLAAPDGSRQPSPDEIELAEIQGRTFYELVARTTVKGL